LQEGRAIEGEPAVKAQNAAAEEDSTLSASHPELIGALAFLRLVDNNIQS
jgi:hypothetical protein